MRRNRLGIFILIIALGLLLRGCILRPGMSVGLDGFNRGTNAAWLGIEWVNEAHTDAELTALADDLQRRQIRSIFVFVSYLRADGTFKNTYAHSEQFLKTLRSARPSLQILAWAGVPLKTLPGGYADLGEPGTRESIVRFCDELTRQHGFDGVHLDPEIIGNGNTDLLQLLIEVRRALDKKAVLSLATHAILPIFAESSGIEGFSYWSAGYYRKLAALVDQIAVMSYDSGLPMPWLYEHWLRFQVINLTSALKDWNGELFIGVPTSEEWTPTHHPGAENMQAALNGLYAGLNDSDSRPDKVFGISIYPYWETDAAEFALYEQRWLGQK